MQNQAPKKMAKKATGGAGTAAGHQIFQEVIVEDEDENFNEQNNSSAGGAFMYSNTYLHQ
jgi:hypothetical protein